jgi:hypothetical protein
VSAHICEDVVYVVVLHRHLDLHLVFGLQGHITLTLWGSDPRNRRASCSPTYAGLPLT